jgi:hypothetical protein
LAAGQGAGRHAQGLGGSILDRPMFVPDQLAPADLPLGTQLQPGHELIFRPPRPEADVLSRVCEAVALARICYRKKLPSFVVTATTVCLLRHYGEPAEMVIGAPQRPFEQHVWIEVGGSVVNERPYARKKASGKLRSDGRLTGTYLAPEQIATIALFIRADAGRVNE